MSREQVGVGRRIGARRAADGRLVDVDHLVQILQPFDAVVLARPVLGPVHALGQRLVEHLDHQARLAAAADAGDADQLAQREAHVHMLQVVFASRRARSEYFAVAGPALGRDVDLLLAAQVLRRQAVGAVHEVVGRLPSRPRARRVRRRPAPCRRSSRPRASSPRRARSPGPCCPGRADRSSVWISRALSRWCRPMLGSSRM